MNIPKIRPQAKATEETPRGSSRHQNPSNTLPSSCSNVVVGIETMERVEQPLPVPTSTSPQQTPKSLQHGQISVEYVQRAATTADTILQALQTIAGRPSALNSQIKNFLGAAKEIF